MAYGVTPTGFVRPRLEEILAGIEGKARQVFGPDVVQTAQSPLGQLNGLYADLTRVLWEIAEATYQANDPDQAEGVSLDQLGRIRLLERSEGELDPAFRQAITNADRARIDLADMERAAASVAGVTWAKAFANTRCPTIHGLPARSIAAAVLGGEDADVAAAVRPYVVPGVDLYGNTRVEIVVDGYCRSYDIVRPVLLPFGLNLTVRITADRLGCPPPSTFAIAETIAAAFTGPNRPANGEDITLHLLRTILATAHSNVELVSGAAILLPDGAPVALPYPIQFLEMATVTADAVSVAIL